MFKIKKINEDAVTPKRSKEGDAGLDISSIITRKLKSGETALLPTGWKMEVPFGYEIQVRPRSGLALKNITVLNSPGTIDCGFRGEVCVILKNLGRQDFLVQKGDRIAQIVINEVTMWNPEIVEELSETARAEGGFGSTGK